MASIREIALEAAITKEKEVLEKAKDIGFKVRNVTADDLTEEQAGILYEYITTGRLPIDFKKPNKPKTKTSKQKEFDTKSQKSTQETENINVNLQDSLEKTTDEKPKKKDPKADDKTSKKEKGIKVTKSILEFEANPVSIPQETKKVQIISKGRGIAAKPEIQPANDNVSAEEIAWDLKDTKEESNTDSSQQSSVTDSKIKQSADKKQASSNTKNASVVSHLKQKKDSSSSQSDSYLIHTKDIHAIPQGFDPKDMNKGPKISFIRVISKNDNIETQNLKKERDSTQILDSLKLDRQIERKEKPKKKKDKAAIKQQKHNSQVITMERDIGASGFDDEQDEIMLIDLYETSQENDEEKNKKSEINDKIKVNRYSPWMKEGSIARPSKGKNKKMRERKSRENTEVVTSIVLPEEIRVYEFAEKAHLELGNVLGKLFLLGVKMLKNDFLDKDTIEILASEYNIGVTIQPNAPLVEEEEIAESDLTPRPPVVTIMGHVDHGKTSLLDYIRNSRIASSEAGGITQHIGAYMVQKNEKWISFIDTPGHEAFAQMRSRGAQVTDIAIIVIAADDGVKQQSIEALNHAKSANVQIIIAMNKMDKEGANPDKLKAECAELGFTPIDWGGEYEFIPISAKTGEGVDILLETILLQAEILELKASKRAKAKAIVLEGSQQVGKGSVATIIVQQGILEVGQSIVADTAYGKVRTLKDDTGKSITRLEPSGVAQITGLSEVPLAGALLQVVENDSIAREIANKRSAYLRQKQLSKSTKVTFDELSSMVAKGQVKNVPVILRADTQGSLEAIKASLEGLNNQEVAINIISFGIGGITQGDIDLANVSHNCVVLGFNVRPTSEIKNLATDLGITIKSYSIIYDLIDDMKALLSGLMSPIVEEEIIGIASIRDTFVVAKLGTIAGCVVVDGKVEKSLSARVLRNGVVLWSGKIASLKRFKDDVKEVSKGYECGIMLDGFNELEIQDELEIFKEVQKQRTL